MTAIRGLYLLFHEEYSQKHLDMELGLLYNIIGECWKPIEGFPSYLISNKGRVWSLNRAEKWTACYRTRKGRFLVPRLGKQGYLYVGLCKDGKVYTKKIHRLVAENFIPNSHGYTTVNHKDEDRTNNDVTNLEWCTTAYNVTYGNAKKKTQDRFAETGWSREVWQLDLKGNLVAKYRSISDARRITGISKASICWCCKGKRNHAGGFIWKYGKEATC